MMNLIHYDRSLRHSLCLSLAGGPMGLKSPYPSGQRVPGRQCAGRTRTWARRRLIRHTMRASQSPCPLFVWRFVCYCFYWFSKREEEPAGLSRSRACRPSAPFVHTHTHTHTPPASPRQRLFILLSTRVSDRTLPHCLKQAGALCVSD